MPLTSSNLPIFLDEIVTGMAVQSMAMLPSMIGVMAGVQTMNVARKRFGSVGGGSLWTEKATSMAEPTEQTVVELYSQDAVPMEYDAKYVIERKLVDDSEWGIIAEYGAQLGDTGARTMEEHFADMLDDLFVGATNPCQDGKSCVHSAHANKGNSDTQSSSGSNSLTTDGLTATRYAMHEYTDDNGLKAPSRLGLIAIGANLETKAQQLAKSALDPNNASNAANVFQNLSYVVIDLVDWTTKWIGIDPVKMKMNLLWLERIAMETYGRGDLFTGKREIGGYMRYAKLVRDWRWVYGNAP
ncbi:MAG TPA: hypothetical protein ENH33_07220 [Actinobacteria bacterium]|nr:hypothetical protein [Actinomycetota bacterium]